MDKKSGVKPGMVYPLVGCFYCDNAADSECAGVDFDGSEVGTVPMCETCKQTREF